MRTSALDRLARASAARSEAEMSEHPLELFERLIPALPPARPFAARLTRDAGPTPRIIAEMKRASPSAGVLRSDYRPRQIAMGYARVGAAALSILTEPTEFGGELSHLSEARAAHLPVMRKDFLVTPYQVAQARAAGADAILLIAAILDGPRLRGMLEAAARYGVEALVEAHDAEDLSRALDAGARVVGVNNRDLRTLQVDLSVCEKLAPRIPRDVVKVAESGITRRSDLERVESLGYDACLIGEHLMRAPDPADALWALTREDAP